MKTFRNKITLVKNSRGCFILDTIKGCSVCAKEKPRGCYDDCYAKNITNRYKQLNFSLPVKRAFYQNTAQGNLFDFEDVRHEEEIIDAIKAIDMPFIRIGEMGDPSEDWLHTLDICNRIALIGKPIVIITKHWKSIPPELLMGIKSLRLFINTSISALDSTEERLNRLFQFERLKQYCASILRIVSCDFNLENEEGKNRAKIQDYLFSLSPIIDTIFRPSANNPLVLNGVIKTKRVKFLKSTVIASLRNESAYLGPCSRCPDMCGINFFE